MLLFIQSPFVGYLSGPDQCFSGAASRQVKRCTVSARGAPQLVTMLSNGAG